MPYSIYHVLLCYSVHLSSEQTLGSTGNCSSITMHNMDTPGPKARDTVKKCTSCPDIRVPGRKTNTFEKMMTCPEVLTAWPADEMIATITEKALPKKDMGKEKLRRIKTRKKMVTQEFLLLYNQHQDNYREWLRRGEFRKTRKPIELSKDDLEYKKLQRFSVRENSFFFD